MQYIKLGKKIKTLELFNKVKNLEKKRDLFMLLEKKHSFNNLTEDALLISNEMKQVERDLLVNDGGTFSTFNFQQKFSYSIALESKEKVLSKKLSHAEQEISEIEIKIMKNIDQKNKIVAKISSHQVSLRNEIEKKYLMDLS